MACTVTLQRGSVFAIKEESTAGVLVQPAAAGDFIPLKSGFAMEYSIDELVSDELLNDEGRAKGANGFENVSGTHGAYAKASEVSGTAPDADLLYNSCLGGKSVASTQYNTVAASTTTVVKVDTGEGATFEAGEALLIQDGVNGYSIRNIQSISGNDLTVNFALDTAPGTGVELGKAVLYKPGSDHKPFSAWLYNGNGGAVQAAAGCRVSGLTMNFNAGQQAEVEFTYEGSKYYYNPLVVVAGVNDTFDVTDDNVTDEEVTIPAGIYTAIDLAEAIQTALNDLLVETYTCTYSNVTGKFTLATSTSSVFSILWNTGSSAATTIGTLLGFSVAANDTGALTYTSDNAIDLEAQYTPTYDNATNIVVKDAEFFLGDATDTLCRCARTISLQVATPTTNVESICSESGIDQKIILSREVTLTAEMILNQYDSMLFDKLKNNEGLRAMVNIGPKSGGNFVLGKCVNIFLQNATVTQHNLTGDDFLLLNLTLKGFVTSTQKDLYINMI